ncbi:MAG: zinc ABC transporter substrate-binding protein [Salaquimonas sp.]
MTSSSYAASTDVPNIVVSIKPLHSLVAYLMQGIGEPKLIMDTGATPHSFSLQPSKAKDLQDADMVIWIGPGLETFLSKPIETIGGKAQSVIAMEFENMRLLEYRTDENFSDHHHENGDEDAANVEHDSNHKHEHDENSNKDPHIWLSTQNMEIMASRIAGELKGLMNEDQGRITANLESFILENTALENDIKSKLAGVTKTSFLVMHDGFQYFEDEFGLTNRGTLLENPAAQPSAGRVAKLREKLEENDIQCVLSEPQFNSRIIETVISDNNIKTAEVDPIGMQVENGPELYFQLMRKMTDAFVTCLSRL